MTLSRNLLVGLANSIWSALIALAVVPLYLKYLGIEAYGVIGFFATAQAILSLLDFGLAPAINREVARSSVTGDMKEARNLLHTLAVIYWAVGVFIALAGVILSAVVAKNRRCFLRLAIFENHIHHSISFEEIVIGSKRKLLFQLK